MISPIIREKCFRLIKEAVDCALEKVVFDNESEFLRLIDLVERDGEFQKALTAKAFEFCSQLKGVKLSELTRMMLIVYDPIADWQDFYRNLGIEADFSNLWIPPKPQGFDRLLIMAEGISSPLWLYDKASKLFLCQQYPENVLEGIISDRTADNGAYAVWVRGCVQADEKLKNFSARTLKEQNISGITLEERILYELKYFQETGGHLDTSVWSLCSGSRDVDGDVPYVCWCAGGINYFLETWSGGFFYVGTADVDGHADLLRSREVITG